MTLFIEMYCILLIITSIVFSAVEDFNLKSKVKSQNTIMENTVKIADSAAAAAANVYFTDCRPSRRKSITGTTTNCESVNYLKSVN